MEAILTLAVSARSSGPTTLFGVPGITGHTICRTLIVLNKIESSDEIHTDIKGRDTCSMNSTKLCTNNVQSQLSVN